MFALCDAARTGTGVIQERRRGNGAEMKNSLMSRLSEATGSCGIQQPRPVDASSERVEGADGDVDATIAKGIRAYPTHAQRINDFTMRNTQTAGRRLRHLILLA
jgi:hypothetical protein